MALRKLSGFSRQNWSAMAPDDCLFPFISKTAKTLITGHVKNRIESWPRRTVRHRALIENFCDVGFSSALFGFPWDP